jgi:hypothetical protein
LQTLFVPHVVPASIGEPFTQVVVPVEHEVVPLKQAPGLPVQPWFAVQSPQKPLPSQTLLAPHVVPPARLLPSTHVCAPVEQLVMPFLQLLGLPMQPMPASHPMHIALALHTMLVPQLVPGFLGAESTQVCAPVMHEVTPVAHTAFGFDEHVPPAVQDTQLPELLQTWLVPHDVPGDFNVPSMHVCEPVMQLVTPL